ncbi:MAG: arginine repressor [Lachnospiraceae bacterium]|nr:arginine repressor [Lachnospiraceae bacterium]
MKASRQAKLIEIIENYDIETQDELAERLAEAGFPSTQATISRDIRELKLTKIAFPGGKAKYALLKNQEQSNMVRYRRVLRDGILTMETAQNIIVIKTVAGLAMAVAAALDNLNIYGVVGSIAGDDTIFCAIRSNDMANEVIDTIGKFAQGADGEE